MGAGGGRGPRNTIHINYFQHREQSGSFWEPAEQGHLISLSDPHVRALHTNAWLICLLALMAVQLSIAIPDEEFINGFPALKLSRICRGFRIKWVLEPDTPSDGFCINTPISKVLKNYFCQISEKAAVTLGNVIIF